jgi:hypothetical protein
MALGDETGGLHRVHTLRGEDAAMTPGSDAHHRALDTMVRSEPHCPLGEQRRDAPAHVTEADQDEIQGQGASSFQVRATVGGG